MHSGEWPRGSNTGRLTQLTLPNSAIRIHGNQHIPLPAEELQNHAGSLLVLFPGHGAKPLTPELSLSLPRPITLLVPDGNWGQTKSMMRRLPLMRLARAVELPGPILAVDRPRRNIFADRMSTFEAIAQAIGILESPEAEEQLLSFFQIFVDRFLTMRGRSKHNVIA